MKKLSLFLILLAFATMASAQSVIVVDSEQVFRSLADYNSALTKIEEESKLRQTEIDARFNEVEKLFNEYAKTRSTVTAQAAQQIETFILNREKEATELQESYFSQNGTIVKMRMELIAPIQKRVFATIEEYAKKVGADIVLDKAANASLLYNNDKVNHTTQIVEMLK